MRYFIVLMGLLLSGCSTVTPVPMKFPEAPATMKQQCPELNKVKEQSSLSDVAKIVTDNYAKYYECSLKNDTWIDWYESQKKIFEGVR